LHFDYLSRLKENKIKFDKLTKKYETADIKFDFNKLDALYTLNEHIQRYVLKTKPSLLISFTKQNRNWFDRLLLASNTSDMVYDTITPMLVFRKTKKNNN